MKFGKRLLDQCVEEWTPFYINYKLLKKQIMRVMAAQKVALRGPTAPETAMLLDEYIDAPLRGVQRERESFRQQLMQELERVNAFYLQKETEFMVTFLRQFEPQVKAQLAKPETISPDMEEFGEFFEFCQHIDALRNFTVLNYIGTLKICKKYDKKTEASEKPQLTLVLMKQPFYTSIKLANLFTEVQCLFAQIVYHAKKVAPSLQDFSCPICAQLLHDPIVLSCTHRFCRSCLANLCSTADGLAQHRCPVCQKEFDTLDPANYHVDSILAKFLMLYFTPGVIGSPLTPTTTPTVFDRIVQRSQPPSRRTSPALAPVRDAVSIPMDAFALGDRIVSMASSPDLRRITPATDLKRSPPNIQLVHAPSSGYFLPYDRQKQPPSLMPFGLKRLFLDSSAAQSVRNWAIVGSFGILLLLFVWLVSHTVQTNSFPRFSVRETQLAALGLQLPLAPLPVFHNTVFVGHKVNDVDSICSAVAAAYLFDGYAARADTPSKEAQFVLDTFGLRAPLISTDPSFHGKNWCLVDHNQLDKVPKGVNLEKLVCVIDHHQLQGNAIEFAEPNVVEIQPWGSTTTILAYKFFQAKIEIPRQIAGCMLAGILSDTVKLQSSTTTTMDRSAATALAVLAGIDDVDAFSQDMFAAKSNIDGLDMEQIMMADYKEYTIYGQRIFFGVAETIEPKKLMEKTDEILDNLVRINEKKQTDLAFFAVVDVRTLKSAIMGAGPKEDAILSETFHASALQPRVFDSGNRVSRKKDFMPVLIRHLRSRRSSPESAIDNNDGDINQ